METCHLCKNSVPELRNSHIIPECLYQPIYDFKHRFIPIQSDNYSVARIEQMGYREKLLCPDCEIKLGKWENVTKQTLAALSDSGVSSVGMLTKTRLSDTWTLIQGINYNALKKCMLSILWRMSISKLRIFRAYALGPYQEKLRVILHADSALTCAEYPLAMHRVTIGAQHYPDLIMGMNRARIANQFIQQSFIVYGFLIDIVLSVGFPNRLLIVHLNETGEIPIRDYEFNKLPQDPNLLLRFNDDDVQKLYPNRIQQIAARDARRRARVSSGVGLKNGGCS